MVTPFFLSIHLPWYFSVSSCYHEMPWLCSNTHHHVFYLKSLCQKAAKPVWMLWLHRRCETSKWATGIIRRHHSPSVVTKCDLGSHLSNRLLHAKRISDINIFIIIIVFCVISQKTAHIFCCPKATLLIWIEIFFFSLWNAVKASASPTIQRPDTASLGRIQPT